MKRHFGPYFEALRRADTVAAVAVLDEALLRGVPPVRLMREVVARGQAELGSGWEEGTVSVAEEHAATAVAEQALAVLAQTLPPPVLDLRVVFACAEGEWHSMPARLAGEQARAAGLHVTMLGGSLPAEHLYDYLVASQPDALALSVTLTGNLASAVRSVRASHRAGVPVIVGGGAWGHDDGAAAASGAESWLRDARDLPAAVAELSPQASEPEPLT